MSTGNAHDDGFEFKRNWRPDPLTTYYELCSGNDPFAKLILRRATANRDRLVTDFVKEMLQQKIAALHFAAWHKAFYFVAMILTVITAIISIIATSKLGNIFEEHVIRMGIVVASLQIFLGVVQSYSNQQDYGAKASGHRNAAATLKKLYQKMKHTMWEARKNAYRNAIREDDDLSDGFDIGKKGILAVAATTKADDKKDEKDGNATPSTPCGSTPTEAPAADPCAGVAAAAAADKKKKEAAKAPATYTDKYNQAIEQVDSMVPIRVANSFNLLEARIRVVNESMFTNKGNSLVAWEQVLEALFFQLTENIVDSPGFPYTFPTPEKAVKKTLEEFKESIDTENNTKGENYADLLGIIMKRSTKITEQEKSTVGNLDTIHEDSATAASSTNSVSGTRPGNLEVSTEDVV